MKKTLLFIAIIASATFSAQTNLVLNGTADVHTIDPNDNADAFDMTPPSTLDADVASPYRALWNNSNLDSWLNDNCGNSSEQPGSSSDGNWDYSAGSDMGVITRGVKISSACRRLYQEITVTAGTEYTFSIDSRSEAEGVPSEVFMLNTAIESETDLSSTSSSVDHYSEITNDFNASKSNATTNNFTTTTFSFTATTNKVVIYVRAPLAINSDNEVFYDNIELRAVTTASVKDVFANNITIYPNPANNFINISTTENISNVEVYNIVGKRVLSIKNLQNNQVDISNLASGMYMLRLTNGTSIATKKIIKQ